MILSAVLAVLTSCGFAAGQVCQKEFDCKTELGLNLQDDYVEVCTAEREGADAALRKNAEKECKDLSSAGGTLAACEATLSCADLVKSRGATDDTVCKEPRKSFNDAATAIATGNVSCDGTSPPAAGEGEGEGEGE